MPRHQYCSIPGCESRSDKPEFASLKFHRLPQSTELRHQWLVSIKRPLTVSENTRICTVHFDGNEKSSESAVPTIFPWKQPRKRRKAPTPPPPPPREPLPLKKKPKHDEKPEERNITRIEILKHEERIMQLEAEVLRLKTEYVERFGVKRFQGSDADINFYTGLPTFGVFMCIYRYIEPLLCQLRLCRVDVCVHSKRSYKPVPRALQPIDELFLVLVRLRLGLLEQDLAH